MLKTTIGFLILITLVSCSQDEGVSEKEIQEQIQMEYEEKREQALEEITDAFQIRYDWNTLTYAFSAEYEDVIASNYQMTRNPVVTDIYKKDSSLFASIQVGGEWPYYEKSVSHRMFGYHFFYFDLLIPESQLENVKAPINKDEDNRTVVWIVDIHRIQKLKFEIVSEFEGDEYCSIKPELSNDFIGYGELIDIMIIE